MEKKISYKFDSEEQTEKDFITSEDDVLPEVRYASPMVISSPDMGVDPALLN